jgi:hypothetical protein
MARRNHTDTHNRMQTVETASTQSKSGSSERSLNASTADTLKRPAILKNHMLENWENHFSGG